MSEPEVMGSEHVYDVLIVERNEDWDRPDRDADGG